MVLLALNTGARQVEICGLEWDWEVPIPELDTCAMFTPTGVIAIRIPQQLCLRLPIRE